MDKSVIDAIALSVRSLTIDAVQKAKSGHPGLPMGVAELGALLYADILRINPAEPEWIDRDRMVLSAGHGCMLLYSLLHMSGFDISLEDIKGFRQLGSKTPGHPERKVSRGIETTTGPLGQGFANGVGMAIAERMMAARFNTPTHSIIDHFTYVISGDGCMMEGIVAESASLAGHLGLGRLIVFYDSNSISIEGSTELAFSEDVAGRFQSYGWHVQKGDAYDVEGISRAVTEARRETGKPSFIMLTSTIGKGSPNMAGSHETHGAPLGEEEVRETKKALGIGENELFYIHPAVKEFFDRRQEQWSEQYQSWLGVFEDWAANNPELLGEWNRWFGNADLSDVDMPSFEIGEKAATRSAGGKVLNAIAGKVQNLVGGAADLSPSTKTELTGYEDIRRGCFDGRNFHFGVREHGMASVANGLALHGGLRPYCSTFMVFSDYMRPPMRLAAMMGLSVVYVLTHDSIFVGEDGPTHQPVEHLAALRIIPNMTVLRPADAQETAVAWQMALARESGPTVLALTRHDVEVLQKADTDWEKTIRQGAYIVVDPEGTPDVVVVATGSEVCLAVEAVMSLTGVNVRVVSMLSRELFQEQTEEFRLSLLPPGAKKLVVEAGVSSGWEGICGPGGSIIGLDRFGESGPYRDVTTYLGFSSDNIAGEIKNLLSV